MLTGLLALAMVMMKSFPATPLARSLHLWMVEWPIEAAARMERKHIILLGVLLFCGPSLAAFGSAEVAMLYAVDLSLYAEAVLVTSMSAIGVSFRKGWATLIRGAAKGLRLRRPRQRARRVHKPRASAQSNDDEPAPALQAA